MVPRRPAHDPANRRDDVASHLRPASNAALATSIKSRSVPVPRIAAKLTDDDIAAIRYAGEHLIAFAGPERIEGATFVCELPQELGAVTKLSNRGGKIVAETVSGTPFIVPVGK